MQSLLTLERTNYSETTFKGQPYWLRKLCFSCHHNVFFSKYTSGHRLMLHKSAHYYHWKNRRQLWIKTIIMVLILHIIDTTDHPCWCHCYTILSLYLICMLHEEFSTANYIREVNRYLHAALVGIYLQPLLLIENLLTQWGRDKMAAIFQTTFSNAFSWMTMYRLRFKFDCSLFPRVQSTISQHWFW